MPTTENGNIIPRFAFWNPATWAIPEIYWDAFSNEQRIHAICKQLGKVIAYADYLGVNVDDIAKRLKAIEDGELNDYIVAAIEAWFEENEPAIMEHFDNIDEMLAYINATIGNGFDEEHTITDGFNSLQSGLTQDIDDVKDDLDDFKDDTNDNFTAVQGEVTALDVRISQLEQTNYSFQGWGGWETLLNNYAFTSGRAFSRSITEKNHYETAPDNYNYSEVFYVNAPMPFNNLNIAGTTDRSLQTVVNANPENHVGLQFRVTTPYNYSTPIDTNVRLVLTGLIRNPRVNPTAVYNAVIGEQIGDLAMTYYQAMLDGREFSYGRNFFYQSSPDDIINDEDGKARMECDTFVGMVLRGIPYSLSPYAVLTPDYRYEYSDLYTDVSSATQWATSTAYVVDDLVYIDDYYYYKCKTAHTSGAEFDPDYWEHVWVTNPYGISWATSENSAMHPANKYLWRDILYAGDIGFLGWLQDRVFSDADQAGTGDVAIWVRRAQTPTYWGGTSQSSAFDNIGHVGILWIEDGQKYILHVTGNTVFGGTVVNKTPIEDFELEQPKYYYRPLYS